METYIKVCGIKSSEDALMVSAYGAEAIGFNLYKKSKRHIDLSKVIKICKDLPNNLDIFLLFVNQERELVSECLRSLPMAIPQFHGEEKKEYCESFNTEYVKAIRVNTNTDLEKINHDYKSAKMLIFDSFNEHDYGGTGKTFDLSLIKEKIEIPFLVAGGIDESNFKQALSVKNCIGIDVCSSIEDEPGIKNPIKVRNLLKKVRSMNV
mgnify:FL=1|jgi:phosphoribosylanthranilate isomerase